MSHQMDRGDRESLLAVYAAVAKRRTAYHSAVWQVPAVCLAAQAFLIGVMADSGAPTHARLGAALFATSLGVVGSQLMARHRRMEMSDWLTLERIERELGVEARLGVLPHGPVERRLTSRQEVRLEQIMRGFTPGGLITGRRLAMPLWMAINLTVTAVAFVVAVVSLVEIVR